MDWLGANASPAVHASKEVEELNLTGGDRRSRSPEYMSAAEYNGQGAKPKDGEDSSNSAADPVSSQLTAMKLSEYESQEPRMIALNKGEPSADQAALITKYMKKTSGDYMTRLVAAHQQVMGGHSRDDAVEEGTVRKRTSRSVSEESRSGVGRNGSIYVHPGSNAISIAEDEEMGRVGESADASRPPPKSENQKGTTKDIAEKDVIDLSDDEDEPRTRNKSTLGNSDVQSCNISSRVSAEERSTCEATSDIETEKNSQQRQVIDLVDDSDDGEVVTSSAADKQRIAELEATLKRYNVEIKRLREETGELNETVEDLKDDSNLASKMVTLRRQNKNAISALKRANRENMAKARAMADEKIGDVKGEYEDKKTQWRKECLEKLKKKDEVVEKAKLSLEELKRAAKYKLEEAKAKAAEARSQKTQNNAEFEALRKELKEQHEDEMLRCRPENNRRVQDREEQIRELKGQIRELEKASAKTKADMSKFRHGIQDKIETTSEANKKAEECHGKYIKYKEWAKRLDADLKTQAAKHGDDKAELVARHEQQQFQQEKKWSLQWNIAQQKSNEVINLSRIVSELRNGQGRRDAMIADLRKKPIDQDGGVLKPGREWSMNGLATIDEVAEEQMTTTGAGARTDNILDSAKDVTKHQHLVFGSSTTKPNDPAFTTSAQQSNSKSQTPEPSTPPGHLINAPKKPQRTAAFAPSGTKTELPSSPVQTPAMVIDLDDEPHMRQEYDLEGEGPSDGEPGGLGGKRKAAGAVSEEKIVKRTRVE